MFHDDRASRLLVAAVPLEDRFGYFGYLKKMMLTLHNVAAMDRGVMPFHGAYTRLVLDDGASANVLLIGDTATGKSETLEALRVAADERIRELRIVADDMGSLEVGADGRVLGYGTEIGAFVRLDDLQQGYAFGQLDRSIIMSPNRVNARVVLPVTTLDDVLHGYPVDYLLYANNYEAVDEEHPVVERFADEEAALAVFRRGAAMSKGTTTATGLTRDLLRQPVRRGAARRAARRAGARARSPPRSRPACTSGSCARSLRCPAPSPPAPPRRRTPCSTSSPAAPARSERRLRHMSELFESNEAAWKLIARGKVRDIYEYGPNEMLIVTSDRLSAFDVILPTPIPDKGIVLTQISNFWFEKTAALIPNHLLDPDPFSTDAAHAHLAGTLRGGAHRQVAAGGGHRARLSGRLRLEGVPEERHGLRHPAAGGPAGVRASCRRRSSRRPPRPRWAPTTRTSRSSRPRSCWAPSWRPRSATRRSPCTRSRPSTRASAASSSPTPSSSSACSTTSSSSSTRR